MRIRNGLTLTAVLSILVAAAPAQAQSTGWLPWIGCWQAAGTSKADDASVCIRPQQGEAGVEGVEVLRLEGVEVRGREVLWSDGVRHETSREGCNGWERGVFSEDGRRLFFTSEHTCDDGSTRTGSGLMALTDVDEWIDVRTMDFGDGPVAWVQHYTPASMIVQRAMGLEDLRTERYATVRAARMAASTPFDGDDVMEAAGELPVEAVEAWIAESGQSFALTGETLVEMADAGLPDRVIDVMVAVSNPDRFQLGDRGALAQLESEPGAPQRLGYRPGWYGPFSWDPFYYDVYRYSPYRFGYGGFSPYGYGYGWGYGGYGYRPVIIHVDPAPRDHGRVVRGRGYTRPGSTPSRGGVRQSRPRPSRGSSAAPSSSSGSRGAASSSGGRKAKRRGGGLF